MQFKSLFVTIAFAVLMLASPASAVDTDGDGLLDLLDVPQFDPSESDGADFGSWGGRGIQDLDGASQLFNASGLFLQHNEIASVERGDFQGLTNLRELYLWANQISRIESGAFEGLTNLLFLWLSENPLTSLESGDFDGLNNLQQLTLGGNQITSIESGDFDGLNNLTELGLGDNQITSLESGVFAGLNNLTELHLMENQIKSPESGTFQGLTNLQTLRLYNNAIAQLNLAGANFERLQSCGRGRGFSGFCTDDHEITSLILDDATLNLDSFHVIVSETDSITDVSLVGLRFSDENPNDLSNLLDIRTLDNVTVSQTLFNLYADEFNAFDAMDGNKVTVVPDLGDYNANGMLDAGDLDLQTAAIQGGQNPESFDLTYDKLVDVDDRTRWVHDLKQTWFGDADLDGEFNSTDLGEVLSAGEYEDDVDFNSGWATGDFNADGDFDSTDLSFALADGGYEQGPRLATAAVPEPSSAAPLNIGLMIVLRRRKRMRNHIVTAASFGCLVVLSSQAFADSFGSGDNAFDIEFVTIGDPGNAADTTGVPNPAGSVDYIYNIGKFEVSRDMVEKANAEGRLGLSLNPMNFVTEGPRPDMPATGVSWNEAARFTNWLNTSQGSPPAYKFSTQPGDAGYNANANIELWAAGDTGFDVANPFRNSDAQYFLPSVNEWYKAAYYDPAANGGAGGYWYFPTGSDTQPAAVAEGTDPNTAVYLQPREQGPADITQSGGLSPYGVMGLGGNVLEWEETESDLMNDDSSFWRVVRGGSWYTLSRNELAAKKRYTVVPMLDEPRNGNIGFRVASIPEPGDYDGNGILDAGDLDLQSVAIKNGVLVPYDENKDGNVDLDDRKYWVNVLKHTWFGDADLDGEFNSTDLSTVLAAGEYEDDVDFNSSWGTGDWNADGDFDSSDLSMALADGGYEQGNRVAANVVPEPMSIILLIGGLVGIAIGRGRFLRHDSEDFDH